MRHHTNVHTSINVCGAFNKIPDFFVKAFKIVTDSWKFTMLLLYILRDDWPIFMMSGSNEFFVVQSLTQFLSKNQRDHKISDSVVIFLGHSVDTDIDLRKKDMVKKLNRKILDRFVGWDCEKVKDGLKSEQNRLWKISKENSWHIHAETLVNAIIVSVSI